jgi:hypothetical protein
MTPPVYAHVTVWGWFWFAWMTVGAGVEIYWTIVNSLNDLSPQIWALEHLDFGHPLDFAEWTPVHIAMTVVLWLFFGWLSVHFPFGYIR